MEKSRPLLISANQISVSISANQIREFGSSHLGFSIEPVTPVTGVTGKCYGCQSASTSRSIGLSNAVSLRF